MSESDQPLPPSPEPAPPKRTRRSPRKRTPRKPRVKLGRPTVMTPEAVAVIERAVGNGLSRRDACVVAGVSWRSYRRYCRKHPDFRPRLVQKSMVTKEILFSRLLRLGKDDWRPTAWALERRYPEEFGRRAAYHPDDRLPARGQRTAVDAADAVAGGAPVLSTPGALVDAVHAMMQFARERDFGRPADVPTAAVPAPPVPEKPPTEPVT